MTKKEEKELREMLTALLEMGYTKEEILAAFVGAIEEKAEQNGKHNRDSIRTDAERAVQVSRVR